MGLKVSLAAGLVGAAAFIYFSGTIYASIGREFFGMWIDGIIVGIIIFFLAAMISSSLKPATFEAKQEKAKQPGSDRQK
jgi:hypothetical protein